MGYGIWGGGGKRVGSGWVRQKDAVWIVFRIDKVHVSLVCFSASVQPENQNEWYGTLFDVAPLIKKRQKRQLTPHNSNLNLLSTSNCFLSPNLVPPCANAQEKLYNTPQFDMEKASTAMFGCAHPPVVFFMHEAHASLDARLTSKLLWEPFQLPCEPFHEPVP